MHPSAPESSGGPADVSSRRTGILEAMQPDPDGEITITVPEDLLDDDATVLVIDLAS